ncbi:MAG: hypothetical protein Q8Q12_00555 [bacterium]|nr:hypothetical protein [bacterium]
MNKRDELLLCIAGHVRTWILGTQVSEDAEPELKQLILDADEEAALEAGDATMADIIESRDARRIQLFGEKEDGK